MSMLEIHAQALASQVDVYHTFLSKYSKASQKVYGFFEGQTDPSYYRSFIENSLPSNWKLESFIMNGKRNVVEMYSKFDWERFPCEQIAFFVDTDLSILLEEDSPMSKNFYTTDGYSIENNLVNAETCRRVLEEVYCLNTIDEQELEMILELFDSQLNKFLKLMIPIMAYILLWRSKSVKLNLNNIQLKKIFIFSEFSIRLRDSYASRSEVISYIMSVCGVTNKITHGVREYEKRFRMPSVYKKFVRGKFLIWFFLKFCDEVYSNICEICPSVKKTPNKCINLTSGNALQVICSRSRIPQSLSRFIKKNYISFQKEYDCHQC